MWICLVTEEPLENRQECFKCETTSCPINTGFTTKPGWIPDETEEFDGKTIVGSIKKVPHIGQRICVKLNNGVEFYTSTILNVIDHGDMVFEFTTKWCKYYVEVV